MPKLIKDSASHSYNWQTLADTDAVNAANLSEGQYLIPLQDWLAAKSAGNTLGSNVGVWLAVDTDPEALTKDLNSAGVIAVEFGSFMDGRGFSLARILREDCDFTGELQASGGYIQDQLFYLKRCGFNAFVTANEADVDAMLLSLSDFSNSYQAASDEPRPLFRRR